MKQFFDYLKGFPFKNLLAVFLLWELINLLKTTPQLHDSCIVLLTLVVKYFYDTSNSSSKKDETISAALDKAQMTPAAPIATI
ncbi:hypothetical protein [Mucilaginibacter sp.]|uniref:hypothetical protein n=1 Tax=Mucilaginibacter sp. TaxID=1882438 RepID=UPI002635B231|nr:hypothetical protein [Mucilaginibacter sp.]MDB5032247.1 hypothetical protein [Mucilaginibacter sp.]